MRKITMEQKVRCCYVTLHRIALSTCLILSFGLSLQAQHVFAIGPCDTPVNAIVAENCQTGSPASEWDIGTVVDQTLQGFATDISVNRGTTVNFKVNINSANITYSIWNSTAVPVNPTTTDTRAVEIGVKFQSDVDGYITGIRFYKGTNNTGTHIGHLWNDTGTLLASATFVTESTTGWQEVRFTTPIAIQANVTYIASYYAPNGGYPQDEWVFVSSIYNTPLRVLAESVNNPNGVYKYGGGFPTLGINASNYWVDIIFNPAVINYRLDIYRMGYYNGMGARKITTIQSSASQPQPPCLTDEATGLIDCGNWAVSASWMVPNTATSGIYFAKLVREDGVYGASHIVFLVRDDSSHSDLLFQTSDTTWQAYNSYGGNSLYSGAPVGRAYKVSYNRPFNTRVYNQQDWLFNAEYPMIRWLEANGYDVSYFTGVDSYRYGTLIRDHKAFLSVGHDEYWSAEQRANVEAARDAGIHLAFFSGNEVFWKTRWENSIDGSNTPYRTLVCYKQPRNAADPTGVWTGTWRDPTLSPPADGGRPENALSGVLHSGNAWVSASLTVAPEEGSLRFWRNTNITQAAIMPIGTVGYEFDEDIDNGFRPSGLIQLSSTPVAVDGFGTPGVNLFRDYGTNYRRGLATHHLTLHRHSSGALVFGAGTVQWSWGLDTNHDCKSTFNQCSLLTTDQRMQQATVNLFADMGVQPATLDSKLIPATTSTDTIRPISSISSPAAGSTLQRGKSVAIMGTASDVSGAVGGVEVSVDDGNTWHPAVGRANWSYIWTPDVIGKVTIKSRAVDDSGNLENPLAAVEVTVVSRICPCSIWDTWEMPTQPSTSDSRMIELGSRFQADRDGYIKGIRFYKGNSSYQTYEGHLWTNAGTLLADESLSTSTIGWQNIQFGAPVRISAGTTYVASYLAPHGGYAQDEWFFATSATSGVYSPKNSNNLHGVYRAPLLSLADSEEGGTSEDCLSPNGAYIYTQQSGGVFPTNCLNAIGSNYWVDVIFNPFYSIWNSTAVPVNPTTTDTRAVEIGVKFQSDVDGYITGIRFYKGTNNTGTHIGHLWNDTGTLLASATFVTESTTGWQEVRFTTPIAIQANVTYIASYYAPNGGYPQDEWVFVSSIYNTPLRVLAESVNNPNGVYKYGGGFPTLGINASNYWVDVIFVSQL